MNDPAGDQEPPSRPPGRKTPWTDRTLRVISIVIATARLALEYFRHHGTPT